MTVWPTSTSTDAPFVVRLDAFSGPLDLLLHLIREQEIDIADIPIATVADQFLDAIDVLGLNEAADYLEMAAQLLRIKIQMLLPQPFDDDEWEDPRAELVRRLLEYEQVCEVAGWFAQQSSEHADRFPRGWLPELPEQPPPPVTVTLDELLTAVEQLLAVMPEAVLHRVVPRPLDVEAATRRISALLEERERIGFWDVVGESPTIADVLSMLIAILELARLGRLRVTQRKPFGKVGIKRAPARATA
ncbi:MAG: segregation/condensation protein A [Gemmatimonadales bacterium]|nr:segregation/condensation protein A [Gemmatimonadales bacterium]NIN48789.1 segregation/condensation protein A [Gemmatimonadales bacterium]NIP06253.1 segregation/condensation protein A [Gemmatimonadales bacterium]NIR00140.1 segregation/condensation protein A [Gemmatimonadales bacterium]NIS64543.1 segregation/condensation protein A [Gemmatimonadales bacterium]